MTEVYKVVRIDPARGSLMSAYAAGILCTAYTVGEETFPELGKSGLFAFDTHDHARSFSMHTSRFTIFRAEATDVRPAPQRLSTGYSEARTEEDVGFLKVVSWWRQLRKLDPPKRLSALNTQATPPGTVICSSIRLVEEARKEVRLHDHRV